MGTVKSSRSSILLGRQQSLFRKRTGVKYVSYLNSIRIEQAKKLLETTDRKLYQIAKAVGYENNKYFFRVFKKAEGVTPEQYRKMQ